MSSPHSFVCLSLNVCDSFHFSSLCGLHFDLCLFTFLPLARPLPSSIISSHPLAQRANSTLLAGWSFDYGPEQVSAELAAGTLTVQSINITANPRYLLVPDQSGNGVHMLRGGCVPSRSPFCSNYSVCNINTVCLAGAFDMLVT